MINKQDFQQALDAGMPFEQIERMTIRTAALEVLARGKWTINEATVDVMRERLSEIVEHCEGIPRAVKPAPLGFVCEWHGMRFRSKTERRIAQALDRANVAFWPNARGRLGIGPDHRENREPDFLVIAAGKFGVLEVDGDRAHPPQRAAADHARDRLFNRQGIRVVHRFPAVECWEDPDRVVAEFLQLLSLNG